MNHSSALAGFGFGFVLIILLLIAASFIFWIWMLIDCVKNPRLSDTEKIIWLLVIFFLHLLGAIIYLIAGRGGQRPI